MTIIRISFGAAAATLLVACQTVSSDVPRASATLEPTKGSTVRGTANFAEMGGRVRVTARISGLKPNGEFGFHIHEVGDCSSGDGMSTKGHFNPYGKPHARAGMSERHAGDLPSLRSDASGNATVDTDVDVITVRPGPASIVGKGLIVHAQADDYKTQPTGNAGARSACAVIRGG
ncbi:MAG TPA: superoxide dismutase family protein [Burkholderiales bacterium]|jgi:Cu-Zn family superoxide dismutase|nr:superoxide dismutase family protein [Burkholderiales bacterium]